MKAITATVLQNVRRLTATTAGTGTTTAVLTAASPIGATVLPSARPVMPTTAGTKRRFRCRPMLTVRPTIPTAPPNVPPGAVTQVITNPEIHAYKPAITAVNVRDTVLPVVHMVSAILVRLAVRPSTSVKQNQLMVEQHVREHGRPVTE